VPPTYRVSIRRFLQFYLGDGENPVPFGGRGPEMQSLDTWLATPDAPRNLLLTAPAAGGKSALLTHWIAQAGMAGWAVVFVPISIRYGTNRPDFFFGALANALADVRVEPLPLPAGDAAQFYRDKVTEWLDDWPAERRRCLIVIDGLDEAIGWQLDTTVLPPRPAAGLRILVSAREMAFCDADEWRRRIGWGRAKVEHLSLAGLWREAVQALLGEVDVLGDAAFRATLAEALFHLTAGDPLLLQLYVSDVLAAQARGEAVDAEVLRRRQPGFSAFFADWMDQQSGFDKESIKACLALLASAAGPLMHADLEALVPLVLPSCSIVDADTVTPIARFVVGDGKAHGYAFAHPKFGVYVREQWLAQGPWMARSDAAYLSWGAGVVDALNRQAGTAAPAYLLNFYFLHLRQQGAPLPVWAGLACDGWRRAWQQSDDGMAGFARDVLEVLRQARVPASAGDTQALALLGRCAFILSSIRARGSSVPDVLLAAAVRTGVMTLRTASNLARTRFEPAERAAALVRLAALAPPEVRARLVDEAASAAASIDEPLARVGPLLAAAAVEPGLVERPDPVLLARWLAPASVDDLARMRPWLPLLDEPTAQAARAAAAGLVEDALCRVPDTPDALGYEVTRLLGEVGACLSAPAAERVFDLLLRRQSKLYMKVDAALIAQLPQPRLAEAGPLVFLYNHVLMLASVAGMVVLGARLDEAGLAALRRRLLLVYHNVHGDWDAARALEVEVGDVAAVDRLLAEPPGDERLDALILMLPLAPSAAPALLAAILAELPRRLPDRAAEQLDALGQAVPAEHADPLLDALLALGVAPDALDMLLPRLSAAAAVRLLRSRGRLDARAVTTLASGDALHQRLGADGVRLLVDTMMGIDDVSDQLCFEGGCAQALPARREAIKAAALQRLLGLAQRRSTSWAAPLKTLAGQMTAAEIGTLLAADPGRTLSALDVLAGAMPPEALPVVLAALQACSVADRDLGHVKLAARFAQSPLLADGLVQVLVDARGRYGWQADVKAALAAMSPAQRDVLAPVVDALAPGVGVAEMSSLLVAAEGEPERRTERLAALLARLSLRAPALGAEPEPEIPGLFELANCLMHAAPAAAVASSAQLQQLFDLALGLDDASLRARALFALLDHARLEPARSAPLREAACQALDACSDPADQAKVLVAGMRQLAPADYLSRSDALVAAVSQRVVASDRLDVLIDLARRGGQGRAREAFREAAVVAIGGLAPELALEFAGDLRGLVEQLVGWAGEIGGEISGDDLRLLMAPATRLGASERQQVLVQALVMCAFMPRQGLLQVLSEAAWLGLLAPPELVQSWYDSAAEVVSWYP
jgi:hypothetical protein